MPYQKGFTLLELMIVVALIMFMLFDRKKFWELGGFHEQILFAEDYRLSQKVERRRFAIVRGGVYTTNRRFKRMNAP